MGKKQLDESIINVSNLPTFEHTVLICVSHWYPWQHIVGVKLSLKSAILYVISICSIFLYYNINIFLLKQNDVIKLLHSYMKRDVHKAAEGHGTSLMKFQQGP